jgi:hypothetical protein
MTDLDDFDDLEIHGDEEDENYVRLRKEDVKRLRGAARRAGGAERELADFKRERLVRDAGIDGLSARQVAILAQQAGDDATPEALKDLAIELGWASKPQATEEDEQREAELAAQHQAAQVGNGAKPPLQRSEIPAEEVAGWPVDKQMRLNEAHPDLYESALQGNPVSLPPGFN